jgi:hypothetical protein
MRIRKLRTNMFLFMLTIYKEILQIARIVEKGTKNGYTWTCSRLWG